MADASSSFWTRLKSATWHHRDIPSSFWTNRTYRDDIARIVCYESSFEIHAENGPQYGWYQMNSPLIRDEGVSFSHYWYGSSSERPGWYQDTAGERYIKGRYGNPVNAWAHENEYGWY